MASRNAGKVTITLSSRGAEALRRDLKSLGPEGDKALRTIERASGPASRGLKSVGTQAKGLEGALDRAGARAGPLGRALGSLGTGGKVAAGVMGGLALSIGMAFRASTQAATSLSNMAKTADDIAISTNAYQAFTLAFAEANVETRKGDAMLKRFNKSQAEMLTGRGELTEKLKDSHPELLRAIANEATMEGKINAVADALRNAETQQEKTLISTAAFGKEGRSMIRVLEGTTNAVEDLIDRNRELGIEIDESVLRRAEEWDNKFGIISRNLDLQFKAALVEISPLLLDVAEAGGKAAKAVGGLYQSWKDLRSGGDVFGTKDNLTTLNFDYGATQADYGRAITKRDRKIKRFGGDMDATDAARDDGRIKAGEFISSAGEIVQNTTVKIFDQRVDEALKKFEAAKAKLFSPATSVPAQSGGGGEGSGSIESGLTLEEQARLEKVVTAAQTAAITPAEQLATALADLRSARAAGLIESDAELTKLEAATRARLAKATATKRDTAAAREAAEAERYVASVIKETQTPTEKYVAELAKLDAARSKLTDGQYAAKEAALAAERDEGNKALAEALALEKKTIEFKEAIANVTAAMVTPQDIYNAKVRELQDMKPGLTAEEYATGLRLANIELNAANAALEKKAALQAAIDATRERIRTPQERMDAEIAELDKQRAGADGVDGLTDEQYAKAVDQVKKSYEGLNKEAAAHQAIIAEIDGAFAELTAGMSSAERAGVQAFLSIASAMLDVEAGAEGLGGILASLFSSGGAGSNFLSGIFGGGGSTTATVNHAGTKSVGSGVGVTRTVPAALFANAPRFHGGVPFLNANEHAAVLEHGERVLDAGSNAQLMAIMQDIQGMGGVPKMVAAALSPLTHLSPGMGGVGGDVYVSVVNTTGEPVERQERRNINGEREIMIMVGKAARAEVPRFLGSKAGGQFMRSEFGLTKTTLGKSGG